MIVPLETKRLFLRPLNLADAAETEDLFPQWEIVKFLNAGVPWPWPKGLAVRQYREVLLPAIERGEEWHWSLRLKDSPERLFGKIGLHQNEGDNRGYWLGLRWQGQGLMTEAVVAVNDYWFDVLGFKVLRGSQGSREHRFQANLGEDRNACDCDSRARLRIRPASSRDMGDYG